MKSLKDDMNRKNSQIYLSEFIATFIFVFWIILPESLGFGTNPILDSGFNQFYNTIFGSPFMKAVRVAVMLSILLYIFGRISCNINPAVTLSQYFMGKHDKTKAAIMMITQFVSGFLAALSLYLIANTEAINYWNSSSSLSTPAPKIYLDSPLYRFLGVDGVYIDFTDKSINKAQYIYSIILIIFEGICTLALLLAINNFGNINKQIKPIFISIVLIIFCSIFSSYGAAKFNPARTLGPGIVSLIFGGSNNIIWAPLYLIAQFGAASYFYFYNNAK